MFTTMPGLLRGVSGCRPIPLWADRKTAPNCRYVAALSRGEPTPPPCQPPPHESSCPFKKKEHAFWEMFKLLDFVKVGKE